ncbi:hypothetical protein ABIA85_007907 [Bradyrhizobium sp. LA6.10]|uniref:hypothetical protein n=1 Tax=Bradyrhizobium sp. LA6.10 TaxID=3156318 RepID=UPI0033997FB0
MSRVKSPALVLPLLLFVLIAFALPIGRMMFKAIHDDTLLTLMPRTTAAVSTWDGKDLPVESVYAALVEDLKQAWGTEDHGRDRQADKL